MGEDEGEIDGIFSFINEPWFIITVDVLTVASGIAEYTEVAKNTQYYFFFAGLSSGKTFAEIIMISNKYFDFYPYESKPQWERFL